MVRAKWPQWVPEDNQEPRIDNIAQKNGIWLGLKNYIYLRNTEFYLTKAEALAKQGKNAEAQQVLFDLNSINFKNNNFLNNWSWRLRFCRNF